VRQLHLDTFASEDRTDHVGQVNIVFHHQDARLFS
jgi:hypothetical protein